MASWCAIRSKPRKENLLFQQLQAHGIEVFFPRIKVKPINPRASKIQAYFPGYLFVHIDVSSVGFTLLNWMPYSLGLVSFGGDVSRVPDELIHTIQKQVAKAEKEMPIPRALRTGDMVTIEHGPFAGYKAMFDTTLSGDERARVLLSLLQNRQLAVDLPVSYLRIQRA